MISSNPSSEALAEYCPCGYYGRELASNLCIEHDLEHRQEIEAGELHWITTIDGAKLDDDDDTQHLERSTEEQTLDEEPNSNWQKRLSKEQINIFDMNMKSYKRSEIRTSISSLSQMNHGNYQRSNGGPTRSGATSEVGRVIDLASRQNRSRKIHLANHFLNWLRGPFKIVIDAPIRAVEVCTQGIHVSDAIAQAVKRGLARQKQSLIEPRDVQSSIKPIFAEITADWTYEGKNSDRGFSSKSIWMRDPRGRRILVKTQDHPMCAANEWLAYTLGETLGLPVNEVQIAIYQNELVTLHTDVCDEHEKAITFIDLPKHIRKTLSTDPTMVRMALFDHIIENVDRNPRNVLLSIPNANALDSPTKKWKIHLIDHSSCFGMGKLNIISVMACKFHSQHLAVVKFDPSDKASKFEQYLYGLPIADRPLIRRTLNCFASITDDQLVSWMHQLWDLLSASQYYRIRDVLFRQRDVAEYYIKQYDGLFLPGVPLTNQRPRIIQRSKRMNW